MRRKLRVVGKSEEQGEDEGDGVWQEAEKDGKSEEQGEDGAWKGANEKKGRLFPPISSS